MDNAAPTLLLVERIPLCLPRPEPTIKVENICVALFDQRTSGDGAHAPAAAVKDDPGRLVLGELGQVLEDLIKGNEGVGLRDLTFIGHVDIDKVEILRLKQSAKFVGAYVKVSAARFDRHDLTEPDKALRRGNAGAGRQKDCPN